MDQAERRSPWVTTTYCDTADWRIYRADEVGPAQHLRFREYHSSRADEAFASPSMFLEVKDNSRGRRSKDRLQITASVLPALLRREWNLPDTLNRRDQVLFLLAAGARPVLVTQFHRIAYAAPGDRIRITSDYNLTYLAIPWTTSEDDAIPHRIGPVVGRETGVVIEMKWVDELPPWALSVFESLRDHSQEDRVSKFVVGMRYLLAHLTEPHAANGVHSINGVSNAH